TGRENAVGLAKEGKHVAVVVRGLDVGDDVEGARGEGQVLRIADLERGLGKAVLAPAELDRPGREVEADHRPDLEELAQHADRSAPPAADVQPELPQPPKAASTRFTSSS